MAGLLSKERIVASPTFNRWLVPPASIAIHLCIGSVYAWSIFNPAADPRDRGRDAGRGRLDADAKRTASSRSRSSSSAYRRRSRASGSRTSARAKCGTVAALCWGGGFLVGALGIGLHQLWLVYLGYGVIGGCGLGLGYVSPVSTLIRWFPDRRGMAAGMAIMGFGGGAIIGAPLKRYFLRLSTRRPSISAPCDQVRLVTEGGKRFAEVAGQMREVVVVGANDVAKHDRPRRRGRLRRRHRQRRRGRNVPDARPDLLGRDAGRGVLLPPARTGWKPAGWTPPSDAQRSQADDQHARRRYRRGAAHAAVLAALDRALLQRDGRHRRAGRRQDDDDRNLRHGPAAASSTPVSRPPTS